MSKYSDFPRKKHDAYQTPPEPVGVLIPHLNGIRTFAEPCFGEGRLAAHLGAYGLTCTHFGDIQTGQDALTDRTLETVRFDAIITNPPYTTEILLPLIVRFMSIAPTWLLLEADWKHNDYAQALIPHCSVIATIGRVRWFKPEDKTKKSSKSMINYAWYRFHLQHTTGPTFIPRAVKYLQPAHRVVIPKTELVLKTPEELA